MGAARLRCRPVVSHALSSQLLSGRVALVTGGGTGLGRAIALALGAAGARAAVNYSSSETDADDRPSGCVFHPRCQRKLGAMCELEEPPLVEVEPGHLLRCHRTLADLAALQRPPPDAVPPRGNGAR